MMLGGYKPSFRQAKKNFTPSSDILQTALHKDQEKNMIYEANILLVLLNVLINQVQDPKFLVIVGHAIYDLAYTLDSR